MSNEVLLILNLIFVYGCVLGFYKFFGRIGLVAWMVIATILMNIEVQILIDAFGLEQTCGNILFASTFLVTDILSEKYSKQEARKVVNIAIITSVIFVVCTFFWLSYTPSPNDYSNEFIHGLFGNSPRIILASLLVFFVVQHFDVWFYHKIWQITEKKFNDKEKFLWVRNNLSTLTSQLINSILFTVLAFWGIYDPATIVQMIIATYIIFVVLSLLDTPFLYLAKKFNVTD